MKQLPFAALCASLLLAPAAQAEPISVPAFTAFSEPKADGIEVKENDGVYNWSDPTQQVVWYGDLRDLGQLQVKLKATLPAGATAKWRLDITGKQPALAQSQKFSLSATARGTGQEQTIDFGALPVAQTGYYRFALSGLEKSGATFGDIKALIFDGPAAASIASKAGFNFTHWRGQTSTHLTYQLPKDVTATAFYNEVTAVTDPVHTYYCAIGFSGGYFGMQVNTKKERRIIFSVWDKADEAVSRSKVNLNDRAGLLAKGEGVFAGDFGNEGTGGHSHLVFPWKTGEKQRFLVTVKPDGDATIFAGFYFRPDTKKWMLISAWRRPRTEARLTGFYSFNEDFGHDEEATRLAKFGNAWVRTADGQWSEPLTARFTRTAGKEPVRREWESDAIGDQFTMQTGGYITKITEYGDLITRQPSNNPPRDLALPPLPAKMPPPSPEVVLTPAFQAMAHNDLGLAAKLAREIAAGPDSTPAVKALANSIERLTQPEPNYPALSAIPASQMSVSLSDMQWDSAEVGYGKPQHNRNYVEGGEFPLLRTSERLYEKGIFAHAPSRIRFNTAGAWKTLTATAGLQQGGHSVVFVVKGDGRELYRSPLLENDATTDLKVNITGVKKLELISEDGGDGIGNDWSVWFEPKLSR
jgi:hypothetical protein